MLIYDVAFSAETDELKGQLAQLKKEVDNMFKIDKNGIKPEAMFDPIKREGQAAAQFLQSALQKATSVDGTSMSRFNAELRKSGVSAEDLAKKLSAAGMTTNLQALTNTIATADTKLTVFNNHIKEMHRVLSQSVKFRAAMSVQDFLVGQAQAAVQWTKDLNQNLVDIQVVSEKTSSQMEKVFDTVITKSKELSTTAKEYSSAALIYYQQGLADEEVARRTEITVKAARAAGEDAEQMSKNLTAIWNTYQMQGDRLQNAASIAARLGADTAVDFAYIAEAMQTSATAAAQMGLSYENLAAIIATVGETTMQASSVVGNAFKTIISRFDQLKATGTDGEVTLGRISQQLADLGIHILDVEGELKSMDQIIYETGDSWETYSQKQQIAIAEVLGGTRQFGQVLALFNNWDKFLGNAATAFSETGDDSLEKQFEIASESIQVAADKAAEAWSRAFGEIANDKVLKGFYNSLEGLGNGVETIIDSLGGLPGILTIVGVAFQKNILEKAAQGIKTMGTFASNQLAAFGKPGMTGAMVGQQKYGEALAKDQTGAEAENTRRQFATETLRVYEQLNNQIRTGTELEKAIATAEKERFTALLDQIGQANIKMEQMQANAAKTTASPTAGVNAKLIADATSMIKVGVSDADVEAIRTKLRDIFGEDNFKVDFDSSTAEQKIRILGDLLKENFTNFKSKADEELKQMGVAADEAKAKVAALTKEVEKQKAARTKAKDAKNQTGLSDKKQEKANAAYKEADKLVQKLQAQLRRARTEAEGLGEALDEATIESNTSGMDQAVNDFSEASIAADEYAQKLAQLQQKYNELGAQKFQMPSFAEAIGAIGSITMAVSTLGSSLVGLFDGEGDMGQEIIQVLIQLAFLGPMAAKGLGTLKAAWTASLAIQKANTAAMAINNALMGQAVTEEAMLAAARAAGIVIDEASVTVNGKLNASLIAQALANAGVTVSEEAMNGAVATNTVVTAANAAAWWAHPLVLIIVGAIAAVVAIFAIFNHVQAQAAERARDLAEAQNEVYAAFEGNVEKINENREALDGQIEALTEARRGSVEYKDALEQVEGTLDALQATLKDMGLESVTDAMGTVTIAALEQAEALAKVTGYWDEYLAMLDRFQAGVEEQRLKEAKAVADDNLTSVTRNMDASVHMGEVRWSGAQNVKDADKRYIEALQNSSAATGVHGSAASGIYGANLAIDTSTAENFVKSYEAALQLRDAMREIERETGVTSDVTRELEKELDKVTDEYQAIAGVVDELSVLAAQDIISADGTDSAMDPKNIKTISDYRTAVDELAAAYEEQGYSSEDAAAKAEGYYASIAAQNTTVGNAIKELRTYAMAIDAAKEKAKTLGISQSKMEDAYTGLVEADKGRADEDKLEPYFARVDFRGYDGKSDLSTYLNDRIQEIQAADKVVNISLQLEDAQAALATFEDGGVTEMVDALEWGKNGLITYIEFLQMSADQQKEYLTTTVNSLIEAQNQGLVNSGEVIQKSITDTTAAMATAQAELEALQAKQGQGNFIENMINQGLINSKEQQIAQFEDYIASLQQQADSNEIQLKVNLQMDADASATLDELLSKLTNGRIEIEQYNAALEGVAGKEAESYGLDADETIAYAKHLQEVAKSSELVDDALANNKKTALEASIAIQRLNRGIDKLADGFEDWNDVLTKSNEGSQEYFEALEGMKDAMADVLNIDASDMSSKFIVDNLKDIEAASEGSVEALARLQLAAGEDIVLQFTATLDDQAVVDEVLGSLTAIQDYINQIPLEIRADLPQEDIDGLYALGQAFIDTATSAGMAAQDIAASLQAMGYNARVVTTYEEGEIEVPTYTTYEEPVSSGSMTAYNLDGSSYPLPLVGKKSYTVPGPPIIMKGQVPVTSVEIEGMSGSFGGNISNYSSKNAGGGSPGGGGGKKGGGGGGSKPKEKGKAPEQDDKITKRYENIENTIEDLTRSVEKLNSAEEHTFGMDRLAVMQKKQKELLKLASAQARYASEAKKYYELDKAEFMLNNSIEAEFDANGYLSNIEQIRERWQAEQDAAYQELMDVYNKLPDAMSEADEQTLKSAEERYEARKEVIDEEIEKLEQLLETEAKVKEQIDAATETFREMMQLKLDEASYKMNLRIQITDMDLKYLDYLLKRIDRMGSSAQKTTSFFDNLNSEIRTLIKQSTYVAENVNRLNEIMNNIEDSSPHKGWFIDQLSNKGYSKDTANEIWDNFQETGRMDAEILDLLMEDADKLLEINQALFDAMYSAWDHYIETFEDFMQQFDDIVGRYEALGERINNINGLLSVFGMTSTRNAQQVKNLGVQFELSGQKMVAYKAKAEDAAAWAADAKGHLDYALASGNQDLINEAQRTYDQLQKTADEAYDDYIASVNQFAQDYVEIWGQMVDKIVEDFSAKIFPLATSMENALESLNLQREVTDFWLDEYQSAYQYDRLLKKIADDSDKITDPKQRALYDEIQAEILKKQQDGALVTAKDVELWEKRLNVAKEQAAFEESLVSKNTMRLARDASGNWSYVYSDDAQDSEAAEDKKAEAEYDYYTAVKNAIEDYSQKLRETEAASLQYYQERAKQRALINAEDTAALEKFDAETKAQMDRYTNLILWYAGKIDEYAGYIGLSHEEMSLTITSGYNTAMEEALAYLNGIDSILVPELNAAETQMRDDAALYLGQIGMSFQTLGDIAQTEMERIKREAELLSTKLKAVQENSQRTLQQMSADMRKLMEDWVGYIDAMIKANEALYESIRKLAGEMAGIGDGVGSDSNIKYDAGTDYAAKIGAFIEGINQQFFKGENTAAALDYIRNDPYLNAQLKELEALRDAKIEGEGLSDIYGEDSTQNMLDWLAAGSVGWDEKLGGWVYWDPVQKKRVKLSYEQVAAWQAGTWKPPVLGYSTGGLVPGVNPSDGDSVPAMLTPAEYVLNPEDTQAFFRAFHAFLALPSFDATAGRMNADDLQQMIQIYADFPNVSSRDEIQAALNNLINQAKQYNV